METREAVLTFSQAEKVKAGLIWLSYAIESLQGLTPEERRGGEKVISALLRMIQHEAGLAKVMTGHKAWNEAEAFLERLLIMVDSGVGGEVAMLISNALSYVTTVAQEAMIRLREEHLI